jgi:hypothetical protein
MSLSEENMVILLRKICALALPNDFDASNDTNRNALLIKLKASPEGLLKSISNFTITFDSRQFIISDYQLKLKAADIWKMQKDLFDQKMETSKESLERECKKLHIDISSELSQLLF